MAGEMTTDQAKVIGELARAEISNWRARMEYARLKTEGVVGRIEELEPKLEAVAA